MNGHPDQWDLKCAVCDHLVDYRSACSEFPEVPSIEVRGADTSFIFIGFPRSDVPQASTHEVLIGDDEQVQSQILQLKRIDGGTWLEYMEEDSQKVDVWLRFVAFKRSKHKVILLNTLNPLSGLIMENSSLGVDAIIIAIIADDSSTSLEKNTSYVVLSSIYKAGFPVILLENRFVEELSIFREDSGLVLGRQAFQELLYSIREILPQIFDLVERDRRLGVTVHVISSLFSASYQVYKGAEAVYDALKVQLSSDFNYEVVHTIYLLGWGEPDNLESLRVAFGSLTSKLPSLLTSQEIFKGKETRYGFFDVVLVYGLADDVTLPRLRQGYEAVANKMPKLRRDTF